MIIQPILEEFKKHLPFDDVEAALMETRAVKRNIKRRQSILQEGMICRHYYFVVKGCFRMYGIDDKGVEHNIQFVAENDWITDIGSFYSGRPSKLYIEALEPSVILQIEKLDLYFLYVSIPKLGRIFKVIIENKYEADIIVLAIWFSEIKDFLKKYNVELQRKIIIDTTNPIAPDNKGGFTKIIGEKESAGLLNAGLLPKGSKLVKALGTLGAASLENAANQNPAKVLFYANDDTSINGTINDLISDCGFEPLRIGSLDQSIRIEVFGDLHEFGALGKTVTLKEIENTI